MRVPGRLHIQWADDNTLQIDTDSGTQTRLLHFEGASMQKPRDPQPQWQGYSVAGWAGAPLRRGPRGTGPAGAPRGVTAPGEAGSFPEKRLPHHQKTPPHEDL